MSETAPARFVREMLAAAQPCCLTSLDEDGRPYGVVVWCALEGDRFEVHAGDGHRLANLRRDPRVSLVTVDTENILRHVSVQGRVVEIAPDRGYAHIDALSRLYEGRAYQYSHPEDVPRYRLVIEADRIRALDLEPAAEAIR